MTIASNKILTGKQAIMDYLQMSEPTFRKFLKRGLPVRMIDKRYYAHQDNIDEYFRNLTSKKEQGE